MATEYVHWLWKRARSEEVSWGVRVLASGIGMFSRVSSLALGQVASSCAMRSALFFANGIESSVNRTVPALPLDSAMIQSALIFATSETLVVMLLKSGGFLLGPGEATACQPMSGMCAAVARLSCCDVSSGSKPPM